MQRLQSQSDDALLARSRELSTAKRDHDAVRLLSVLLRRPALTDEVQAAALRQRTTAWLGLGQERRAWRDLQTLSKLAEAGPWARLQQLHLLGRHARSDDTQFEQLAEVLAEVLAIARAHPELALAWRVAGELSRGTRRLGLSAEITLGLARADRHDVATSCRAAAVLRRRGEQVAALHLIDEVITAPESGDARLRRARAEALLDLGDTAALLKLLPLCVADTTADVLWLSRAWLTIGEDDKAGAVLRDVRPAKTDPSFPAWHLACVELLCRLGHFADARTLFETVPETQARDARLVVLAAEQNWVGVAAAVDQDWTRSSSQILVAEALRRQNSGTSDDQARNWLSRAQKTASSFHPALLLNRLMLEPQPYLVDACTDAFGPMLSGTRPSETTEALTWLRGQADSLLRRLNGVRDDLLSWRAADGSLKIFKPDLDLRGELAAVRQSLGDLGLDGTIARYQAVMDRRGVSPLVYTYRAEVRLWVGDVRGAIKDIEAALGLDVQTRWAYIGASLAQLVCGNPQAALLGLDQAEQLVGPLSAAPAIRAEALLRLSQHAAAEQVLIAALHQHPTRVSAWLLLALARLRSGVDAQDIVDAFAQRYPDLWQICRGADVESRLEDALFHMRGNRSSGLITWADPRGWWRSASAMALLPTP